MMRGLNANVIAASTWTSNNAHCGYGMTGAAICKMGHFPRKYVSPGSGTDRSSL
ncbi:hypothetical protein PAXRUDRAFT_829571 [Paxillus rubicundulus Ve08.2h10]|uniref:Uncharacterized protein n=1 Tax=Paxillus rubicundulus Ve08.2h10 TaxID=930991 RepID=A0A0D0DMJ2_9AGAM|nr:hypothetical protein PAXRUDRAFT_829571 [Paxillus rubicundulus Ve08.2h10]